MCLCLRIRCHDMNIDFRARKFKYLISAAVQAGLIKLWFEPILKINRPILAEQETKTIDQYLLFVGNEYVNILFITLSVLGVLLFLLPLVVTDKRFSAMIDIPVTVANALALVYAFMFFDSQSQAARKATEYGIVTECSFTITGIMLVVLVAVQLLLCIVSRIQAKNEKRYS